MKQIQILFYPSSYSFPSNFKIIQNRIIQGTKKNIIIYLSLFFIAMCVLLLFEPKIPICILSAVVNGILAYLMDGSHDPEDLIGRDVFFGLLSALFNFLITAMVLNVQVIIFNYFTISFILITSHLILFEIPEENTTAISPV